VGAQFGIHAAAAVVLHDAVNRLAATQELHLTAVSLLWRLFSRFSMMNACAA